MCIDLPHSTLHSRHFIIIDQFAENESWYSPTLQYTSSSRSHYASVRQLPQSSLPRDRFIHLFANHFLKKNYPNYHGNVINNVIVTMFSYIRAITYLRLWMNYFWMEWQLLTLNSSGRTLFRFMASRRTRSSAYCFAHFLRLISRITLQPTKFRTCWSYTENTHNGKLTWQHFLSKKTQVIRCKRLG